MTFWPRYADDFARIERDPRGFFRQHLPMLLGLLVFFALPWTRELTGVDPRWVAALFALQIVYEIAMHWTSAFERFPRATTTFGVTVNVVVACGMAILAREPLLMLWAFHALTMLTYISAFAPSVYAVLLCFLAPLVGGPLWLWRGDLPLATTMPQLALVGVVVSTAYFVLARSRMDRAWELADRQAFYAELGRRDERLRIAADLHDTLGASLAEATLWLDLSRPADDGHSSPASRATRSVRQAVMELRAAVQTLSSGDIAPEALRALLSARLSGLAEPAGASWTLDLRATAPVGSATANAIARIIDEAATNALRHGGPKSLRVEIDLQGPLSIVIEDDGVGFDPTAPSDGMGLSSMTRRAAALGASLAVVSSPRGTCITIRRKAC